MRWERSPRRGGSRRSSAGAAIACSAFLSLLCGGGVPARAAGDSTDVAAGRNLADRWCAECHQVAGRPSTTLDQEAPAFYSIANQTSTTAMSLRAFLATPHPNMPNFRLSQAELSALTDYILSMRER
jgi:mono/diheme cytochrome c family protein